MSKKSMYEYCLDMLINTNEDNRSVESLQYTKNHIEYSFLGYLYKESKDEFVHYPESSEIENADALIHISEAMDKYLNDYPAAYSVKQRFRKLFLSWLHRIAEKYQIAEPDYPDSFTEISSDTAIAMIQMLQDPNGVTKQEMEKRLHISDRAILKNLSKLDHSLGDSKESNETLYIGGQPIKARIKSFRKPGLKNKCYRTVNTIHPLVLQENVMQAGTLIQSLARNYTEHGNDICYAIALDIWSQLSEYGRDRIKKVFIPGDRIVRDFIEDIDNEWPDEKPAEFFSEKEMREDRGLTGIDEILQFYIKSADRHCNLTLSMSDGLLPMRGVQVVIDSEDEEGKVYYRAIRQGKEDIIFTKDQVVKAYDI